MRQIQSIFCDDIRQEVGGKLTFVGVYTGFLLVQSFPLVLPKFFVSVSFLTSHPIPHGPVTVRVLLDDAEIAARQVDLSQLVASAVADRKLDGVPSADQVEVLNTFFVFAPLHIEGPSIMRIRASVGGDELKALGLRIAQLPPTT